jgi:hypothetical protein
LDASKLQAFFSVALHGSFSDWLAGIMATLHHREAVSDRGSVQGGEQSMETEYGWDQGEKRDVMFILEILGGKLGILAGHRAGFCG